MCILVCVANLDFCKGTGRPAERRGVGASEMEFFGFFKAEVKARGKSCGSLRQNLRGQAGGRSVMVADHAVEHFSDIVHDRLIHGDAGVKAEAFAVCSFAEPIVFLQ